MPPSAIPSMTPPEDIPGIIAGLEATPAILRNLLRGIPQETLKARRIPTAWTIHEHACHIASGDRIGFIARYHQFIEEDCPAITPLSGESFPKNYLMEMDLVQALEQFEIDRREVVGLARGADASIWAKTARHPEYSLYSPYIMLRHRLMHDHLHLYRIEELWLTRDACLR